MGRVMIIGTAVSLALIVPAAAQQRVTPEQALTQLHGLCERDYKPACIKFGLIVGKLPPREERRLRREHPDWWWWERW
jgi:hypothetical protein